MYAIKTDHTQFIGHLYQKFRVSLSERVWEGLTDPPVLIKLTGIQINTPLFCFCGCKILHFTLKCHFMPNITLRQLSAFLCIKLYIYIYFFFLGGVTSIVSSPFLA